VQHLISVVDCSRSPSVALAKGKGNVVSDPLQLDRRKELLVRGERRGRLRRDVGRQSAKLLWERRRVELGGSVFSVAVSPTGTVFNVDGMHRMHKMRSVLPPIAVYKPSIYLKVPIGYHGYVPWKHQKGCPVPSMIRSVEM